VVTENGPFLSGVKHSNGGEARLCGARINGEGSYVVQVVEDSVDISHLAPFQTGLDETFQTRSGIKSLGATIAGEADRLCHGVSA